MCTVLIGCGSGEDSAEIPPTPEFVEKTLYVAPSTELCENDTRECLLVRESNADEWQLSTDTVAGFDYVAGYTYKLRLRGDSAQTTEWTLVDILSQEGSFQTNRTEAAEEALQVWYLDYMLTNSIALDTDITMTFGDELIQGTGGCNQYTAGYNAAGDSELSIEGIGATKKLCSELVSQQERDYFDALSMVAEYEQLDGSTLIFRDIQGTPVLTFVTSR